MNSDQQSWPAPRGRHRSAGPDDSDGGPSPVFEPRADDPYGAAPRHEYGSAPYAEVTAPYGTVQAPYGDQGGYAPGPYWQPPDAGWQQQWPGGAPWEPPPRRRTGLIVVFAIVGVVVVLGALLAVIGVRSGWMSTAAKSPAAAAPSPVPTASPTPTPRSLAIPKSFGDYTRSADVTARRQVADMRKAAIRNQKSKSARAAAAKLKIGIFRLSGITRPELFVIGFAATDSPFFASELRENSPSEEVDFALTDLDVTHSQRYSPGTLGGALRCGRNSEHGVKATVCAWADDSVSATVLDFRITKPAVLAGVTRSLRGAAER